MVCVTWCITSKIERESVITFLFINTRSFSLIEWTLYLKKSLNISLCQVWRMIFLIPISWQMSYVNSRNGWFLLTQRLCGSYVTKSTKFGNHISTVEVKIAWSKCFNASHWRTCDELILKYFILCDNSLVIWWVPLFWITYHFGLTR